MAERPRIKVSVAGWAVPIKPGTGYEFRISSVRASIMDRSQKDEPPFVVYPTEGTPKEGEVYLCDFIGRGELPKTVTIEGLDILIEENS